jgi:hypothetical protein
MYILTLELEKQTNGVGISTFLAPCCLALSSGGVSYGSRTTPEDHLFVVTSHLSGRDSETLGIYWPLRHARSDEKFLRRLTLFLLLLIGLAVVAT